MTVLHVLHHYLPRLTGYALRSRYLLEQQRVLGLRPIVLTSHRQGEGPRSGVDRIDGLQCFRTPPLGRWAEVLRLAGQSAGVMKMARRTLQVTQAVKPHLLHAHSPVTVGLAAMSVARYLGIPFVYEVRDFWENAAAAAGKFGAKSASALLARRLETHVLRRADAVVSICESQRAHILGRGASPDRVWVVPNGVDTHRFSPRPRNRHLADALGLNTGPVVGYIGAFLPYEGLMDLLEGFALVRRSLPEARLLLVGEGDGTLAMRQRATATELRGSVIFAGRVPHEVIGDYYSIMDVLVYPRPSSAIANLTTPLKPLEAMALGKAVLCSDVLAVRELVQHGRTGILFRAGDVRGLARRCQRLLSDTRLRASLSQQARRYVVKHRQWAHKAAAYLEVYGSVLDSLRSGERNRLPRLRLRGSRRPKELL